MNGISLLVPELAARIGFGALLIVNGFVFGKRYCRNILLHLIRLIKEIQNDRCDL